MCDLIRQIKNLRYFQLRTSEGASAKSGILNCAPASNRLFQAYMDSREAFGCAQPYRARRTDSRTSIDRAVRERRRDPESLPPTIAAGASIGEETAEAIAGWEKRLDLAAELKRVADFGARIVVQDDPEYPALLRQIYDPPIVLYVKGSLLPKDKNAVAMVGSRMTTHYGTEVARKLAYQLAYLGVTVVSGGARGIDTAAHQGALSGKGRTVAVLGTGINLVFPPENAELYERIAANGALVTQFAFNRQADKQTFPIRNRIVAGMTLGTVVVEANLTSGALITANFATEYGRRCLPSPAASIRRGARVATN